MISKQYPNTPKSRGNHLRIAVVDDEKIIRDQMKNFIIKQGAKYDVESYDSGQALLKSGKMFDIIFIDIQMKGMNGIETAKKIREGNLPENGQSAKCSEPVLIFITGLKEYVFDAFDVCAFHYLLKPIREEKFAEVFSRAALEIKKRNNQKPPQLFIKSKGLLLYQGSILYLESRGKKVAIHMLRETIEIYGVLNKLERQLSECFYRCHRGYLVNMAYVTEFDLDNIILNNGDKIYLARKKHKEFAKVYMWYLQNGGISCV